MKFDLIPGFSCVVTAPVKDGPDDLKEATDAGYKIIYILAANGDKYQRRTFGKGDDGQIRYSQRRVTTIAGLTLGDMKDEDNFLPAGKVPVTLLWEVEKFFKAVIAKFGDKELEAMIWIMWNPDRGYFLHVPGQKVAGAAVEYDWSNLPLDNEGKSSRIIVDIHSHANFGAFFSGTDDRDDSNTVRYSGVIGYNRRPNPEMRFRFNFLDIKTPVGVTDIFDVPRTEVGDTPIEWLDKVEVTTPAVRQYGGTHGNYSGGYGGRGDFGGGHGGHYSTNGWVPHRSSRKTYEAPMPSNATGSGWRAGEEVWFLKNGGYITFDQWEVDYPKIIAERERKAAEKKGAKTESATENGGQQGTRPLSLTGPQSPDGGKSSLSQKETNDLQRPSENEKPESNSSSNSNSYVSSGIQFPSNPFTRSFAREETQENQDLTQSQTFGSQVPSTHQSSGREPQPEPEPAKNLTTTPLTTNLSNSTSTVSRDSPLPDPLTVFTKPQAYISEDQDGYSVLTLVTVKPSSEGPSGPVYDEMLYRREMEKNHAQGKASEGILPVETPQLQSRTRTPSEEFRDNYLAGCKTLPNRTELPQRNSEVSPLGGSFSAPTLQPREGTGQLTSPPPTLTPTLLRKASTTLAQTSTLVDTWLSERERRIREEFDLPVRSNVPVISERLEDRMHQRARQEELLSAEDDLEELQAGMPPYHIYQESSVGESRINVWPDNTVVLRMEKGALPIDFDINCVNFGKKLAGAKAVLDVAMDDLLGSGTLVRQAVQDMFEMVNEDERLPLFRTLAESLPSKARESLESNGL